MNQPLAHLQQGQQAQAAPRSLAQIISQLPQQSQLANQSVVDPKSLAAGIKPSFASITFKGKTWGIRHRGVTHQLLARDPNTGAVLGSIPTIDLVILKSATAISKSFYIEKYKEGDFKQPDCWSTNGQVPDPAAPKRQSATCRGCKWDAFGSRTMDDGRAGKACSDAKRLAVVPAADLKNEVYGGPMLLKLPPSAFNGLSELEAQLLQAGYNYFAVIMRLSFDYTVAFPKIVFTPIGVLNDYQMTEVLELQKSEVIDRILSEELYEVSGDPNQPTAEPEQQTQPQVQPVQPVQQHVQPTVQQPQPVQAFSTSAPPPIEPVAPVHPVQASAFVAQPVSPNVGTQAQVPPAGNDPGPMPAHLVRTAQPNGTAGPTPQPVQEAVAETAEQRIARLEAALAAATAKPPRQTRRRTAPVTPAGNGAAPAQVQPLAGPALPLPTTAPTQPNGGGVSTVEQRIAAELPGESIVGPDDEGDVPADLASRVDALLNPTQ